MPKSGCAMLHEAPSATTPTLPRAREILGGDAWLMPREPGLAPWVAIDPPRLVVRDQRTTRRAQAA